MPLTTMTTRSVKRVAPVSPPVQPSPRTSWTHVATAAALLLIVIVCTFPVPITALQAGLDNSWIGAMSSTADRGLVFGRDVMFTYGPLGFAANPIDIGDASWATRASLAHLAIYIAWWVSLGCVLFSKADFKIQMLFVLSSLLRRETVEFIVPTVLGLLIVGQYRHRRVVAVAASVIAATALLIKFNTGVSAIMAVSTWALLAPGAGGIRAIARRFAVTSILIITTLVLEYGACGGGLADLLTWIRSSLVIASDYSSQMSSSYGPSWQVVMMLAGLTSVVAYGAVSLAIGWNGWRNAAIILFPLFVEYKHAITRHDDGHFHQGLMVSLSIILLLLLGNQARSERRLIRWLAGTYFTAALAVWLDNPARITLATAAVGYGLFAMARARARIQPGQIPQRPYRPLDRVVAGLTAMIMIIGITEVASPFVAQNYSSGLRMIEAYGHLDQLLAHIRKPEPNRADALPAEVLQRIGQAPVDVYPTDIALALRNHLNWSPRFVFQSYQAYNPVLDLRSAKHYEKNGNPPDFVLYSTIWFDTYNQCVVDCATWNALYRWYDFVSQPLPDYLLLRRRQTPRWTSKRTLGNKTIQFGERWEVPKNDDASIILKASIKLSTTGKIMRTLFRVDPAAIKIEYEDGTETVNRTGWRNLESGFLVSDLPKELAGARSRFQGNTANKVKAITFLCNPRDYEPQIPIEWSKTELNPIR